MSEYDVKNLRNICVLAHGGAGKTTLVECMLYNSGVLDRFGKVTDGNTTTDYDPEEIKRQFSINLALAPVEYKDYKINFIDTPGFFDFVGEEMAGIRAAASALILVSGKSGVAVGTEKAYTYAQKRKIPTMFFVNKMEDPNADFAKVIDQLREKFGKPIVPFEIPYKEDGNLIGVIDVLQKKVIRFEDKVVDTPVPNELQGMLDEAYTMITEAVAETSDELMEKYFAGEEFTEDEIANGVKIGVAEAKVIPVFGGSAMMNIGVKSLARAIGLYLPSPAETGEINTDPNAPLSALVFKTISDPFVGKISYLKVYSGVLKSDSTVYNSTREQNEKIGSLFFLRGKKQIPVKEAKAGDIVAVAKLSITKTNDTLCTQADPVVIDGVEFPEPTLMMAIEPKVKGDEEKIAAGLNKIMEEDKTIKVANNVETHQMTICGVGEQQLDIVVSKLQSKFGVGVNLIEAKVPYREMIKSRVEVEGKHKKQSGGHGQYGHVKMIFEQGTSDELEFSETIYGGSVPKQYHPAVEKGLQDCIKKGVLAGYPVVKLKATLTDGSYHDVDSSEMAFKMAATKAYKEGLPKANPVLLEPIATAKVYVPEESMGDIIGDLNKKRGRVLGMNPTDDGLQEIIAEVPLSEMYVYAINFRSLTSGRGYFEYEFTRYEEAPPVVRDKVIEEAKKHMEDEE